MLQVLVVAVRRVRLEIQSVLVTSKLKPVVWPRQPRGVNEAVVLQESDEHAAQYPGHGDLRDVVFSPDLVSLGRAVGRLRLVVFTTQPGVDVRIRFTTASNVRFKPLQQLLQVGQ